MRFRLKARLLVLIFILFPSVGLAQGFFERQVENTRKEWRLFLPESTLDVAFPEQGNPEDNVAEATDYRMKINIPARRLFLYESGSLIRTYPVAVGTARYKTPIGPRYLSNITWNPWWYPPPDSDWAKDEKPTPPGPNNPLGRVKMSLGGDIFLHATNKEYTVGTAASHGCMRMKGKDAAELAWFFQKRFSDENDEELLAKYQKNRGTSFLVPLKQKIPVDILYERVRVGDDEVEFQPDIYGRDQDLKEEVLNGLAAVGIPPWVVDSSKVEELKRLPGTFTVSINDLISSEL